jgi:PhnB protein
MMRMPVLTPVFNFTGNCEEAMALYAKAFGTKPDFLLRYADADPRDFDKPLTDTQKRMIYHAEMHICGQRVMFSDIVEFDLQKGTALFLTVTFDTPEDVKGAYEVLKDGATILYPMHSTTYSSCLVSLIDRYGNRWGLMTENG